MSAVVKTTLRRLAELVLVFLGVTFIIYTMVYALPGDPIRALGGDRELPENVIRELTEQYMLDRPVIEQYVHYLGGLLRGDLGTNFSGRPVQELIAAAWPVTAVLALSAWVLEALLGVGFGMVAALRKGGMTDRVILNGTVLAISVPVFIVGTVLQLVFGVRLDWLPVAGTSQGWPESFVLPAATLAIFGVASVTRLMRTSVLDELDSDYIRAAHAAGLPPSRVVGVHVARNSIIPTMTYLTTDLGQLLSGAVIVEGVFNLPGVGNLLFTAIRTHEGPTIVGVSTMLILIFLVTGAVADLLHALIDPRIRHA